MKQLSLKEIQIEETKILKCLVEFLEENNITYFIWAGSFLGCVRHKGFIPWDDDIDIAIERKEYTKLVEILKSKNSIINERYSAIGFELDNDTWPFIKIIDNYIQIKEKENVDKNLWIDIFPIDGAKKSKYYYAKLKFLRRLYLFKRADVLNVKIENNGFKKMIKIIARKIFKIVPLKKITERYIKESSKYDCFKTGFACCNIWGIFEGEIFNSNLLLNCEKYKFENIFVNGIKDYDTWLSIRYGNYMALPPKDKRNSHNFDAWLESEYDNDKKFKK